MRSSLYIMCIYKGENQTNKRGKQFSTVFEKETKHSYRLKLHRLLSLRKRKKRHTLVNSLHIREKGRIWHSCYKNQITQEINASEALHIIILHFSEKDYHMKYSLKKDGNFYILFKILQIFISKHSLKCKMNRVKASQIMKKWGCTIIRTFYWRMFQRIACVDSICPMSFSLTVRIFIISSQHKAKISQCFLLCHSLSLNFVY